jgi:ketosteroid isomerase-like protein
MGVAPDPGSEPGFRLQFATRDDELCGGFEPAFVRSGVEAGSNRGVSAESRSFTNEGSDIARHEGEIVMKRAVLFLFALAIGVVGPTVGVSAQKDPALEKNKVLGQRFHLDMIAKGDLKIAEEIIAPDCVIHLPSSRPTDKKGPERAREIAAGDLKAFPKGIKLDHHVVFAEGPYVGFTWTLVGTRESGEQTTLKGIDVVRIANGKIAEMWIEYHNPNQQRQGQQQQQQQQTPAQRQPQQ